jgi:O-antigen ligase
MTELSGSVPYKPRWTPTMNQPESPVSSGKSRLDQIETVILSLLLLGPVFGCFFPFEGYFNPQVYTLASQAAPHEYVATTLLSHLIEVFIVYLIIKNFRIYVKSLYDARFIILFLSYFAMSTFWSENFTVSAREVFHLAQFFIIAIHLFSIYSLNDIMKILTRLFLIAAILSFGVFLVSPTLGRSTDLAGYEDAWRGVYNNKNALGAAASIGVIVAAYSTFDKTNRFSAILCLLLNLVLLVLCRSASSVVATAVCGGIAVGVVMQRSIVGRMTIVISIFFGMAGIAAIAASGKTLTSLLNRSADFSGRTEVWRFVIAAISRHPLWGYGLGFWGFQTRDKINVWMGLGWAPPHAHDDMLDITLQVGIFGTMFYLFSILVPLYAGWRALNRQAPGALVCVVIVFSYLVHGLTETVSIFPGSNAVVVLYIAEMFLLKIYSDPSFVPDKPRFLQTVAEPAPMLQHVSAR